MKTYVIKYNEGIVINQRVEVKAKTMIGALMVFLEANPNANYESVEVKEDETISTPSGGAGSNQDT